MTFKEFTIKVDTTYLNHPELRYGQTIMNTLHGVWQSKFTELVANHLDSFYDDDAVPFVLEHLGQTWKDKFPND
jgi:hypothetical protein